MATTTMTSPTPASEKMHIKTTRAELMTIPGTAEPIEARVPDVPAPVSDPPPPVPPPTTTDADMAPSAAGADVPRKRSLLKRRSLRSKAEPAPAPAPAPERAQAPAGSHDPTQMPVPQPALAPTAPTTAEKEAVPPAAEEPVKRKRSLLKRRSLRSKPEAVAATTALEDAAPAAQPTERTASQLSPASPDADGILSRDYTKLPGQSARSVKSTSIASPPVVAAPAPAPVPSSRPQSRATNATSRAYGDSDSEGEEYSDIESDEPNVASYSSPVSHGGRAARQRAAGHRRNQTVDHHPTSAATELVRSRSRPRSMGAAGVQRANTAMSHRTNRTSRTNRTGRTTATNRTAVSIVSEGGAFGHGAGTVGPGAVPEPEESEVFRQRAAAAGQNLGAKQSKKIYKEELKEGKRLSKILRAEGKVERQALIVALKELSELQSIQKASVKGEAKAHSKHAKALKASHASELALLEAQRKHELAQTALAAQADALEYARRRALEATQAVAAKNREVDLLRAQKGADAREREVKLTLIQGKTRR